MTTPFQPLPCASSGAGGGADVEQLLLCDLDAEGNLLGTALAVYEYDAAGNPVGAPTFVNPTTGAPYVPQGTLQPCPDAACLPPVQFCQTSTTTGPVDHPGRQYDLTLPINPGFAVQSLTVDAVTHAAGITWEVDDPDGETFRQNLTTFIEGRVPAPAVVTITNPNAGTPQVCGAAQPMQIHIECIRLDQDPPDLIELIYNGGQDLIQNPAYNEFPALNPPVSQGNYGFHLLSREDDPGPFPGNPPAGDALCTTVANRGWETNDVGRTFEIWGQDVSNAQNTTPTPRGTPVQEITSDGPPPGGRSTIWQTFMAPASGNFLIRVVHGARDAGEQHRITLDNGDTNDAQNGDLIDDISNPPSVTSSGGPNPWTQFSQTIPLVGGSTYTLALSTNNPAGGARGGLFTDMRAYIDRPDQRATATTDDETCVVTTDETTTTTTCSYWQPQCAGGVIVGWQKADTGETLTNAEFWAQVPTPSCCLPSPSGDGGASSTLSNMLTSDLVCATVGGVAQTAIRIIVTDPSGGVLQEQFVATDGTPVSPATWTPGPCASCVPLYLGRVCDSPTPPFTRELAAVRECDGITRYYDPNTGAQVVNPALVVCTEPSYFEEILCDAGNADHQFIRRYVGSPIAGLNNQMFDFEFDGQTVYAPVGPVGLCADVAADRDREVVCWTQTSTGDQIHTGTIRHDDTLPAPGWLLFDQHQTLVPATEPGLTFVPCGGECCPVVVGEGCWETVAPAASGRWTSLRMPDGTVLLVDQEDGHTVAPADVVECAAAGDSELVELCDNNGTFLRRYLMDAAGDVVGSLDLTLAGAPYVPVGPVTYGCTDPTATAQIIASCDDVGSQQFITGPNLLVNGDFERSSGLAASSVAGPGWVTSYVACGPNIFAGPCGAATWAYFNDNAGSVTGGNATATQIEALGARSMAVNVGPNTAIPIIEWPNIYLENGKTYELSADAAVIFAPYDVAIKIGGPAAPGGLFPLSTPPTGNWGKTTASFTYTGTTGYTSVGVYSNSGVAGGNDHTFDNFALHSISQAQAETLTPVVYSGTQRAIVDQVVETTGCNDDRRDALLGDIADAVTPRLPATLDATVQRQTGAGTVTIAAGARSVTVAVLTGPVTVNLGQGVTTLPSGTTLTWAVDGVGETLAEAFAFTGVAGSDFVVTSTRQ